MDLPTIQPGGIIAPGLGARVRGGLSVPLARVDRGEARESVEALEHPFRQGREAGAVADVVEAGHDEMTGAVDGGPVVVVQDAAGLETLDVSQKLLAEEVREGLPLLGIQRASGWDVSLYRR